MASYRVGTAADAKVAREVVAEELFEAHQRAIVDGYRLNLTVDSTRYNEPIRACGYDPENLLYEENVPFRVSTDWGFEVLQFRAGQAFASIAREERVTHLAAQHSPATMAALAQCLNSPIAPLCRGQVGRMMAAADTAVAKEVRETQAFAKEQDQAILCTFLDGAAARRGIAKTTTAPKPAP
ncbi:hypothetical protein LRS12_16490 [Sphingomonas sp. J344]|nr:hypothetical protein [Sphingomonas sp. J344]MCR5872164.1 hypothetical protein [Sphingomonas sp. J344]